MERGLSLIMTVIFPHLCRPAANKYTKVHPVSLKVTLMLHFYGLLRRVLLRKCGSKAASSLDDDQSDFEDNAVLGVPDDVLRHFRKVGSKMLDNNASFVFDPFSKMRLLIWCVVCAPVMVIHWSLFKRGTWCTHVPEKRRCGVFALCSRQRNPVVLAMTKLASMVFDLEESCGVGWKHLHLVWLRLGQRIVHLLQTSIVLEFCHLWRKIVHFLDCYPWKLAPAFDPLSTSEEITSCAKLLEVAR